MDEMTGGATNLAAFMQKVQFEREKTNAKMEKLLAKLDRLETQVCKDGGSNELASVPEASHQ